MTDNYDDFELLLDSPVPASTTTKANQSRPDSSAKPRSDDEAREASLKHELESLQRINQVIEGVVESLEKAKENVTTVQSTVNSASTLLETWTRILSQAEHNQRLILNPRWQGATQDLADMENEQARRAHEAQRRQIEEQARREAAARKAEEDERKKAATVPRGAKVGRGHSRLGSRTTPGVSTTKSSSSTAGRGGSRAGSSIGRGSSTARSRGARGRGL